MFFIYWISISYYSLGQTVQLLWRVGLILGPLWATPFARLFCCTFDAMFNKKTCAFLIALFQKLEISFLCTPSFILCSSFFLLWPSCFLKFPHISCSFTLVPSFFSLKSKNSAFFGKLQCICFGNFEFYNYGGGHCKFVYLKLAPNKLSKNIYIYFEKLNSTILGGHINQRLGLNS